MFETVGADYSGKRSFHVGGISEGLPDLGFVFLQRPELRCVGGSYREAVFRYPSN
jgi:hypothetical protein